MEERVALLAIIVKEPESVVQLNALLHEYAGYIIGRMGIPCRDKGLSIISVAMSAPGNTISALSGKIGRLRGITAKTVYAPNESERTL